MNDELLNTIEVLTSRIRIKDEESTKLKKVVNELCAEAGVQRRYGVAEVGPSISGLRSDEFYGQTLTAAIRNYLERRRASGHGAAPLPEIYKAIKDGGYKFETNSDANAQISVGNTLRKTSSIFHRLPNGQYGLLAWYPSAKATNGEDHAPKASRNRKAKGARRPKQKAAHNKPLVTQKEIREIVLAQQGEFTAKDVENAVKAKYPGKAFSNTKIPSVLYFLKTKQKLIKQISERSGTKGALYAKV